jgi:hypothetical protein
MLRLNSNRSLHHAQSHRAGKRPRVAKIRSSHSRRPYAEGRARQGSTNHAAEIVAGVELEKRFKQIQKEIEIEQWKKDGEARIEAANIERDRKFERAYVRWIRAHAAVKDPDLPQGDEDEVMKALYAEEGAAKEAYPADSGRSIGSRSFRSAA